METLEIEDETYQDEAEDTSSAPARHIGQDTAKSGKKSKPSTSARVLNLLDNTDKYGKVLKNTLSTITANMNSINQVLAGFGEYTQLLIAKEKRDLEESQNN